MVKITTDPTQRIEQKNVEILTTVSDVTPVTIAAGARLAGSLAYGPSAGDIGRTELLNVAWRIRVDVDDENHTWSGGPSLTAAQRNITASLFWNDEDISSIPIGNERPPGERIIGSILVNNDSNPHDYFVRWKIYSLRVAGETT